MIFRALFFSTVLIVSQANATEIRINYMCDIWGPVGNGIIDIATATSDWDVIKCEGPISSISNSSRGTIKPKQPILVVINGVEYSFDGAIDTEFMGLTRNEVNGNCTFNSWDNVWEFGPFRREQGVPVRLEGVNQVTNQKINLEIQISSWPAVSTGRLYYRRQSCSFKAE